MNAASTRASDLELGRMCLSGFYAGGTDSESIFTIHRAIELDVDLFDTADMYGPFTNEKLVGRSLKGRRDEVVIATKFGNERREDGSFVGINGLPEYVRQACDASLKRLGVDTIDLYYQHRVAPDVPIEDTVGAMKELVEAGKVRDPGMSEAAPGTEHCGHLEENVAEAEPTLTEEETDQLDGAVPMGAAAGERYPERAVASSNHQRPRRSGAPR